MFEGTHAQMWASLSKLLGLPPETLVFCAHEYTQVGMPVHAGRPCTCLSTCKHRILQACS